MNDLRLWAQFVTIWVVALAIAYVGFEAIMWLGRAAKAGEFGN